MVHSRGLALWASSSVEGGRPDSAPHGVAWRGPGRRVRGCSYPGRGGWDAEAQRTPQLTHNFLCIFHVATQLHLTSKVRARVGERSIEQVGIALSPSSACSLCCHRLSHSTPPEGHALRRDPVDHSLHPV